MISRSRYPSALAGSATWRILGVVGILALLWLAVAWAVAVP